MVDKICDKLMDRVKLKMPEVDEERAEVIRYGFELMIGEIPKFILMILLAIIFGQLNYFLISVFIIGLYRIYSGGFHLKTHIGCFIITNLLYFGNVFISKELVFTNMYVKCGTAMLVGIFAIWMVMLYAPADTDAVPILRKSERKKAKKYSIIIILFLLSFSLICQDNVISNMCIVGIFLQTLTITKLSYKLFKAKYGYFEYIKGI